MRSIDINNIPEELAGLKQWCECEGKRPKLKVNDIEKAKPLYELTPGKSVGIILSKDTEYAVIDIDAPKAVKEFIKTFEDKQDIEDAVYKAVLQKLPIELQEIVYSTYSELSLSRAGVHTVIKVDKSALPQKSYIKGTKFSGQLSLTNNFMVMTGDKLSNCPDTIVEVPTETILQIFEQQAEISAVEQPESFEAMEQLPSLQLVEHALNLCPMDQNGYLQKVYKEVTGQVYEHYNYWLIIGMALHDYSIKAGQNARVYSLFLAWSQLDEVAYAGEDDVEATWASFGNSNENITYKTLMRFASLLEYNYPRTRIIKGKKTGVPINVEYVNFEYLLNRHNIKLYDSGSYGFFLTGDKEILDKYFRVPGMRDLFGYLGPFSRQQLCGSTLRLCQDSRYRDLGSTAALVDTWLTTPKEELDFFKLWLDTPEEELPEELQYTYTPTGKCHISKFNNNSTFDYILSCIDWNTDEQDERLSKKMLFKTFMQLIKFHENIETPFTDNGGFLAFIGPENTYKTTFFKMLLPQPLSFLRKELNMPVASDKGIRDFIRYLGTRAIVQIDEFEGFLDQKKFGPILKAVISGNDMSLTDIFQTNETDMPRRAIIVGTSNEKKHILSANGSRRMWWCAVNKIDTQALLNFNWHKFYKDLRDEFRIEVNKGETPWLLSRKDTMIVTERNNKMAAKNEVDLVLEEVFPYDEPINYFDGTANVRKMSTLDVRRYISMTADMIVSLPSLERALERFCGIYTGTQEKQASKYSGQKQKLIVKGMLYEMKTNTDWRLKRWILPPADKQ